MSAPKRVAYFRAAGHSKEAVDLRSKSSITGKWIRTPSGHDTMNLGKVLKNIAQQSQAIVESAGNGVAAAAEHVMTVSKQQTPVATGILRSSGFVSKPKWTGSGFVVTLGYTAPYALHVHEDLTAKHNRGTKAKFLEDPMRTEVRIAERIVAAYARKALGRP